MAEPTIRRSVRDRHFTILPNGVLENAHISTDARWLLAYLLSKSDNWIMRISDIRKQSGWGRDKAYKVVQEIVDARYAVKERLRSGGRFGAIQYTIYDEPVKAETASPPCPENTEMVPPFPEKPDPEKPDPENQEHTNKGKIPNTDSDQGRESACARDPVEKGFKRIFPRWPTHVSDSEAAARKEWFALDNDQRADAEGRLSDFLDAHSASGRTNKGLPSFAKFLSERMWERLPPKREEKPPATIGQKPHSWPWSAFRFAELAKDPEQPKSVSPWIAEQIAAGDEKVRMSHQANTGWPTVNGMHEKARHGHAFAVPTEYSDIGADFEPVKVGSSLWQAWKAEHEARGWPWFEGEVRAEWSYMPAPKDPTACKGECDHVNAAIREFQQRLERDQ